MQKRFGGVGDDDDAGAEMIRRVSFLQRRNRARILNKRVAKVVIKNGAL